jgi:pyruvate dehydrogenase E2 component (dihydrolipoamide acetyltransferase)
MATQVVMPKLSPTMEEGQLSRWLKKEGDKVSMGEPIAEIDTDKATMEMQALGTGVLRKILIAEGETAPLGQLIAIIGEPDEDISALVKEAGSSAAAAENKQRIETSVEGGQDGAQQETAQVVPAGARTQATIEGQPMKGDVGARPDDGAQQQQAAPTKTPGASAPSGNGAQAASESERGQRQAGERLVVSPIAARMAAEAGINLRSLSGSGPGGRIVKRDIEAAISAGQKPAAQTTEARTDEEAQQPPRHLRAVEPSAQPSPQPQPSITGAPPFHDEPSSPMRQTIARRLVTSIGPVPHFFLTTEIEMDKAAEMRRNINELDQELKASVNDLIIKVTAHALMQHPQVNASFQEKAVRYYERADIGVAVAIEDGLITPVIRSANTKSIGAIAREVRELAERARAKKLHPDEYTGATFSISNLGMMGIDEFTAVINPPEAAILAIGAMTPKPVVRDGEIVVRQMMRVTMSCDHRVIDGATGARFLQTFKKILENPLYLIA